MTDHVNSIPYLTLTTTTQGKYLKLFEKTQLFFTY
jgi:hypothetical protein